MDTDAAPAALPSWSDILKQIVLSLAESGPTFAFVLLIGIAVSAFVYLKVWPWLTGKFFPWAAAQIEAWHSTWKQSLDQLRDESRRDDEQREQDRASHERIETGHEQALGKLVASVDNLATATGGLVSEVGDMRREFSTRLERLETSGAHVVRTLDELARRSPTAPIRTEEPS